MREEEEEKEKKERGGGRGVGEVGGRGGVGGIIKGLGGWKEKMDGEDREKGKRKEE